MVKSVSGKVVITLAALAFLALLLPAGSGEAQPKPAGQSNVAARKVERGKYLVTVMICNDCHTPYRMGPKGPEPDMSRMLSGHPEQMKMPPPPKPVGPWIASIAATNTAFAGPWGISYTSNLTPDKNTGLGTWTEDMFLKAMKTGKHMGTSREIQPLMPWPWIGQATDEDLKAIFAYLQSIPAIVNHVPDWEQPPAPAPPPAAKGAAPKKK
jgi:mono/diheme cytochrome c family protein